jgi:hypothetical protein
LTDTENKVKQQADRHEHELFEIEEKNAKLEEEVN